MASAGDLISPSAENLKLDRSQSVKTQQDTDKMRQHVYELRMKFLGQEIPAVYPYKLYIDGEGTDEKDMVDDEITEAKKSNQVIIMATFPDAHVLWAIAVQFFI